MLKCTPMNGTYDDSGFKHDDRIRVIGHGRQSLLGFRQGENVVQGQTFVKRRQELIKSVLVSVAESTSAHGREQLSESRVSVRAFWRSRELALLLFSRCPLGSDTYRPRDKPGAISSGVST